MAHADTSGGQLNLDLGPKSQWARAHATDFRSISTARFPLEPLQPLQPSLHVRAGSVGARAMLGLEPGEYARLTACETGCGMDAGTSRRSVESLVAKTPDDLGSGCDLSVVQNIMKAHPDAVSFNERAMRREHHAIETMVASKGLSTPASQLQQNTRISLETMAIWRYGDSPRRITNRTAVGSRHQCTTSSLTFDLRIGRAVYLPCALLKFRIDLDLNVLL